VLQWRSRGRENARREPLDQLGARRSRRIITSALDDQLAMDGGPVPGHSLFTGCLIEAMTGGLVASVGHRVVTGSEIGHYVQRRVSEYPGSAQTPDFGALELDDRGELLVRVGKEDADAPQPPPMDVACSVAGTASVLPSLVSDVPLSMQPRARNLRIGGVVVMMMVGAAAALYAMRDGASVEDGKASSGEPSDAGVMVVAPPDAALAIATSDAAKPDASDARVESATGKTDRERVQRVQPTSRRESDASSTESDRPRIDDRGN
jgi:hypothetical protein